MGQDIGTAVSATVRRWQLTEALRHLREDTGMTIEQAAIGLRTTGTGRWSASKLSRIETRRQDVQSRDVRQLLDLYGITDIVLRNWMTELALSAHERGYWRALRKDLPEDFHEYLKIEAALEELRQFETMSIPGLLQTADFARAVINGADPMHTAEKVGRRVLARMSRQQVLTRTNPLRYHVILEEAILERAIGTQFVMRDQLRHLVEATTSDHTIIQVLPKSVGASPALDGPFAILTLPDPIPDFCYAESGGGSSVFIEDRELVRLCTLKWAVLVERSLSPDDSVAMLAEIATHHQ